MGYLASGLEMLGKVAKQYKFIQRFHLWLDVGAVCVSSARTGYRVRICAGGLIYAGKTKLNQGFTAINKIEKKYMFLT